MPQAVSAGQAFASSGRLLVEIRPPDAVPDMPQRRPHGESHHRVLGEWFTGQLVKSCTISSCKGTVRGFPDFDSLTNSVGTSDR